MYGIYRKRKLREETRVTAKALSQTVATEGGTRKVTSL